MITLKQNGTQRAKAQPVMTGFGAGFQQLTDQINGVKTISYVDFKPFATMRCRKATRACQNFTRALNWAMKREESFSIKSSRGHVLLGTWHASFTTRTLEVTIDDLGEPGSNYCTRKDMCGGHYVLASA